MPKGSKILMADDDAMLLDMYRERLELAGYIVTTGTNGEELLTKLKESKPDIRNNPAKLQEEAIRTGQVIFGVCSAAGC